MIILSETKSICPVLISEEGAGKGTLIELIRRMLGIAKVFETTDPNRDVWGSFNSSMTNSYLVVINELGKKDTFGMLGKIKGLITDTQLNINQKGIDVYSMNSYHRFLITTNELEPIHTSKGDRRNLIIRSSDELIQNKNYFIEINNLIDDVNVVKTCFEYFKNIEGLDKFGLLEKPVTDYQKNLQELSISPVELWIREFAFRNDSDIEMTGKEAYQKFTEFCQLNGFVYEINSQKLGVKISNLKIKGIARGRHTKLGESKLFKIKELRKHFNQDNNQCLFN
jgi:phage/plasmid-associated DNA primase